MTHKVLVTTRSFRRIDGTHKQILLDAGCEIINSPYDRPCSGAELGQLLPGVAAAILGVDEVNAAALENAADLKVISRFGVGVDTVDLDAATARGIVVTNTPGANRIAVAELTFSLMLALARQITITDQRTKSGQWSPFSGMELYGSTLGLIGMGRIGSEVATRAAAFGMRILFYDPYPPPDDFIAQHGFVYVGVDDLLAQSDFVSLHLPLLPTTQHILNRDALSRMKRGAYLINTARGGLVDEDALADMLRSGHIAGAAFDAFAQEPPTHSPLLALDNFIATPHAGSATVQTTLRMGLAASENVLAVLRGERPEHVVNPEVYAGDPH